MAQIYRRPELAGQMARQLLRPGVLDEGLRSGLFISGLRRIGKTTFLQQDLIPALEAEGAVVIYVDLWAEPQASPMRLVLRAIKAVLGDLQSSASALLGRLKRVGALDVGFASFRLGFKVDRVGESDGPTIAEALTRVVDETRRTVVLIVDEVQHALSTEDGQAMMLALKAARDAINARPDAAGSFVFIGTGSHRSMVHEMTTRRNQAFTGATSTAFPVLGRDFVEHQLARLQAEGLAPLPSADAATGAFARLGGRPEEFTKALRQLISSATPGMDVDRTFEVIADTLRSSAADMELSRVEQVGALGSAIFDYIAGVEGDVSGLFTGEAAERYSAVVGRVVRIEEIQPVVLELMAANVIMRRSHGKYAITDPFVQEIWRERRAFRGKL